MGESVPATPILDTQLFLDAFNASPIGIAVENLDGQPLFVNPAFCRFLGFTEEELRRKGCVDFSPKEDAEKDRALFQQLRAGSIDHYQLEKRYFRRDGSLVWGSLSISLLNSRPSPLVIAMVEDITEKKTAEEARFRLAAIVESSEDAIIATDVSGTVTNWNKGAERLYGYSTDEAVGKHISFLRATDRVEEGQANLKKIVNSEVVPPYETVCRRKNGASVDIWLTLSPVVDSAGRIVGVSGIARDTSDQKRREEKLREYERAIENAEEMIAVIDREYRYLIANRQFLKLRNKTQEQVVGRFADEVLKEGVFEAEVKPRLDECFQGKVVRYEMKYTYPELGERDLLVSYFPIEGANGIDRAASIIQDITDRKRSEESLRESEERFRLAAQVGRMYSYEWDVTTDVLVRSAEYVKILGVTEPLRFTRQQFMDKIHPDDRPRFIAAIAGLTPENPTRDVTYRVLLPGGAFVWLKNSGRGFFDGEGKMLRVIGMVADVTDQKLAEGALSDMTRKLIEAQEQERSRLGRELHDDINQRLAMLSVELEQQHDPSEFQNRVQRFREELRQISDDVQALSHDLDSTKLEYLGVVAGMKSWCKEFAERQKMDVDFRSDVRSVLPLHIGRPLFRVLQEALHNSFKHSGVKRVEVQLREESSEIHLIVRDLGRGFDVEAALHGKGLGLTSMRERVRLVSGTIVIDSKPMGGTNIHARVPFTPEYSSQRLAV